MIRETQFGAKSSPYFAATWGLILYSGTAFRNVAVKSENAVTISCSFIELKLWVEVIFHTDSNFVIDETRGHRKGWRALEALCLKVSYCFVKPIYLSCRFTVSSVEAGKYFVEYFFYCYHLEIYIHAFFWISHSKKIQTTFHD